jgi:hypothetical protein
MSKPLAFLLILVIVVAGQIIALGFHLKKNRTAIVSSFGSDKNFWLAACFPSGENGKILKNYPQMGKIRSINYFFHLVFFVLFILLLAL